MKKILFLFMFLICLILVGCSSNGTTKDINATFELGEKLASHQPTPSDVDYSLERYNLIKRTYWVNGNREKAMSLPCQITKPLGYIILITDNGSILGRFTVDGKVSSLNSWLTPDYYYNYTNGYYHDVEMPDVDGTYGKNDSGIFFFTTDGKYIEWTGKYLYSDIPFIVEDPVLKVEE